MESREISKIHRKNRSVWSQILAGILVNSIYEMRNYPVVLVNTVLSPLSFLILIFFVSHGELLGEAVEGGLIMSMFSAGMALQGDMSHLKNDFKLQDMIVSSPTKWSSYMIGIAASEIVYSIPALAVLGILGIYTLHVSPGGLFQLIGVLFLLFLTSIALGYTFATLSSDIVQSYAFSRLLSTLFSTLPPVYYLVTYIPLPWRYLAYISPTTYAAELAQNVAGYLPLSNTMIWINWIVLILVTVGLALVAKTQARWREI